MEQRRRQCVLVVDDNEANRALVMETLRPEGIDVAEAASGIEALALTTERDFDLILLDVRMPGMDGFATLEALRRIPRAADVPVVFLTAQRDIDTFDKARAAGCADFLTKPVRPTELLVRVESLLRIHQLGSEVRSQVDELRKQRDDLMRLQLQKERMSAFLVHDLKNPLASMRLEAEVILRSEGLTEDTRQSATAVCERCDRLNELILNLLDLAKADEGQLEPRRAPFSLAALFERVAASLSVHAQDRQITVRSLCEPSVPATWNADADLLRRALDNLAENAVRYAPRGGQVTLTARSEGNTLEIRVVDDGPGIPADLASRVFDPFVQAEGSAHARAGRGLGLAFCRMTVEAHGGRISVEPTPSGATFLMRFPLESDS